MSDVFVHSLALPDAPAAPQASRRGTAPPDSPFRGRKASPCHSSRTAVSLPLALRGLMSHRCGAHRRVPVPCLTSGAILEVCKRPARGQCVPRACAFPSWMVGCTARRTTASAARSGGDTGGEGGGKPHSAPGARCHCQSGHPTQCRHHRCDSSNGRNAAGPAARGGGRRLSHGSA